MLPPVAPDPAVTLSADTQAALGMTMNGEAKTDREVSDQSSLLCCHVMGVACHVVLCYVLCR